MLHVRTVHSDQSYERLRIQIIHASYGFKQFAREINRRRELFLNFCRGARIIRRGVQNYSRACIIRFTRVFVTEVINSCCHTYQQLEQSAHTFMNMTFFQSRSQFCKMCTIDRLVRTCMPSPLTGHIPVKMFNPGDR